MLQVASISQLIPGKGQGPSSPYSPMNWLKIVRCSLIVFKLNKSNSSHSPHIYTPDSCSHPVIFMMSLLWNLPSVMFLLYWGTQIQTQHTRFGLTSSRKGGINTSLDLLGVLLTGSPAHEPTAGLSSAAPPPVATAGPGCAGAEGYFIPHVW